MKSAEINPAVISDLTRPFSLVVNVKGVSSRCAYQRQLAAQTLSDTLLSS